MFDEGLFHDFRAGVLVEGGLVFFGLFVVAELAEVFFNVGGGVDGVFERVNFWGVLVEGVLDALEVGHGPRVKVELCVWVHIISFVKNFSIKNSPREADLEELDAR